MVQHTARFAWFMCCVLYISNVLLKQVHPVMMKHLYYLSNTVDWYQVSGEPGIAGCIVVDRTFTLWVVDFVGACLFVDHCRISFIFTC